MGDSWLRGPRASRPELEPMSPLVNSGAAHTLLLARRIGNHPGAISRSKSIRTSSSRHTPAMSRSNRDLAVPELHGARGGSRIARRSILARLKLHGRIGDVERRTSSPRTSRGLATECTVAPHRSTFTPPRLWTRSAIGERKAFKTGSPFTISPVIDKSAGRSWSRRRIASMACVRSMAHPSSRLPSSSPGSSTEAAFAENQAASTILRRLIIHVSISGPSRTQDFASFVIFDKATAPFLVFENNVDGSSDEHLCRLIADAEPGVDRIFRALPGLSAQVAP